MTEAYTEQIVKKQPDSKMMLKKVGIMAAGAALTVANFFVMSLEALGGGSFILLVEAAIIFGAYWLLRSQNIEYEYIFVEDEIGFDRITARTSRKRLFTADCGRFELMARADGAHNGEMAKKYDTVRDFSSAPDSKDRWFAVINGEKGRTLLIFEPEERMVEAVRAIIKRKVLD